MNNETTEDPHANCIPPAIGEFPSDGFTAQQRTEGWITVHVFISLYIFIALAIVCDEYFVPAVERMSRVLDMSTDVAGATLMAVATSSPEFFVNLIGTFITEGDLGIGTIVGSAVFNMLGVSAVCGIFSGVTIKLDWWPLTRDCFVYGLTVGLLIFILADAYIHWYEALYLCIMYLIYLIIMYNNKRLSKRARESKLCQKIPCFKDQNVDESKIGSFEENDNTLPHLIEFPFKQSCIDKIAWSIQWPLYLVFFLTIPDCRMSRMSKCFCLSFVMCCFWIAILTYLVSWSLTIIGHTFQIPDSVMGITVLAIGTSVPEAVSSINVARRGHGSMAICNSVGSNTFDILICLGVPWLIKASFFSSVEGGNGLKINSSGIIYALGTLLASIFLLYGAFCVSNFILGKYVGYICSILYASFLVFATLMEMNFFIKVNNPTCPTT